MNRIARERVVRSAAIVVASTFVTTGVFAQTGTEREDPNRTLKPGQPAAQQDRTVDQQRPGAQNPELRSHLQRIQMLEGDWDVQIVILSGSGSPDAQTLTAKGTATRNWMLNRSLLHEKFQITDVSPAAGGTNAGTSGATDSMSGGQQLDQQKQKQIEDLITRTLTSEADMERAEAQQAAQRITREVVQKFEQGQTGDLGQTLTTHLTQAGVDREDAREIAQGLESQIKQQVGQPGRPAAGAQTPSQPGGQKVDQQKQKQIEDLITRTLTADADMERAEAQQTAQRITREVVQKFEQGQTGDLGQTLTAQLTQAGVDREEAREIAQDLERQIKQQVQTAGTGRDSKMPSGTPGHQDIAQKMSGYEGLGLFGYDLASDRFSHFWADSASGNMILSFGEMNESTKTIVFARHYGEEKEPGTGRLGSEIDRARDLTRRDADDQVDDEDPDLNPIYGRDTPDLNRRPGSPDVDLGASDPTVVLQIVSDQKHVIRMLEPSKEGRGAVQYEITYTKKGTSQPTRTGEDRGNPSRNPSSPGGN